MNLSADAITMQLRVAACVVIVALVRVLNIAVPVLYRNAVNKLAEVSDLTHPTRREEPQTFTFMDVSLWELLVLFCEDALRNSLLLTKDH